MIRRILLILFLFTLSQPAVALDPGPIGETLVAEWEKWMKKHRVPAGSVIVAYNGTVVAQSGIKRSVDDPAKIASLSKSITAVCALHAANAAGKPPTTRLSEAIPTALATHAPRDANFANITIAQLITHTSGIASTYHRSELPKLRTFTKENKLWQFSKIVREKMADMPGLATYTYSNANYLTLGLVIEELSGEPYEDYCIREILVPAGITTGKLNADWRVMSSWGGWEMSAQDFLTFAQANFTGDYSPSAPAGYPLRATSMGRGRSYGAGLIYRSSSDGINAWHQGSWRGVRGRANDPFGAYVALYGNGFSVVTNYAHDAWDRDIANELDSLLYKSTHP